MHWNNWLVGIEVLGWNQFNQPQNAAAAYAAHRLMWERAILSLSKGIPTPEAWYTAVVETHDVEISHTPSASGHPSAGEKVAVTGFMSGRTWTVAPIVRNEAAKKARLLMVCDSGAAQ